MKFFFNSGESSERNERETIENLQSIYGGFPAVAEEEKDQKERNQEEGNQEERTPIAEREEEDKVQIEPEEISARIQEDDEAQIESEILSPSVQDDEPQTEIEELSQSIQEDDEVQTELEESPELVRENDKDEEQNESEESPKLSRKKRKIQKTTSTSKGTSTSRASTSRPSTSRDHSKITPFLPNTHMWEWASQARKRYGKKYFHTIKSGEETISIGDSVLFISDSQKSIKPYIGKIQTFWEAHNSKKWVKVNWFYHPDELQPPCTLDPPVIFQFYMILKHKVRFSRN